MASDEERRAAAERLLRARNGDEAARSEPATVTGNDEEDEDDLRARFPDVDADERLRVPQGRALPEVPQVEFSRPRLPQPDPEAPISGLGPLKADLRGMGEASTIGMTLVFSIAIGAGLGYLVDRFVFGGRSATPWGLIVGFLMGTASGFINLVRVANRLNDREERRQQRRDGRSE
jgi:F0F1-type ATP synthase assembly protein I